MRKYCKQGFQREILTLKNVITIYVNAFIENWLEKTLTFRVNPIKLFSS
jgi:hypothetical protein